jgi:hypothetical protein
VNACPHSVTIRTVLVDFLIANPAAAQRLLSEHTDNGHGRCRTCTTGGQRGFLTWPCTLHTAAQRAHAIARSSDLR